MPESARQLAPNQTDVGKLIAESILRFLSLLASLTKNVNENLTQKDDFTTAEADPPIPPLSSSAS
jgi:hypothetical protein